jgi:hypothetical protein
MRIRYVLLAGTVALSALAMYAAPSAAAKVHCPKGYRCIPIGQQYQGSYQSQEVAPAQAPADQADNYIKPETGLSHPNGVGW